MKWLKRQKLHKIDRHSGASLAIVICVSAMFITFSLSLMYSAGLLIGQANKHLRQERCYQLAKSFALVLEEELTKYNHIKREEVPTNSFYQYANEFLNGLHGDYDPNNPEATIYHYTVAIPEGVGSEYGTIKVLLSKQQQGDEEVLSGVLSTDNTPEVVERATFVKHIFTVRVVASWEDSVHSYETEYSSRESYEVEYRTITDDKVLVWNGSDKFYIGALNGSEYTGDLSNIRYSYNPTKIVSKEYRRSYEE